MNVSKMFEGVVKITAKTSGGEAIKSLGGEIATVGKRADAVNMQIGGLSKGLGNLKQAVAGVSLAGAILEMSRATIQLDAYRAQLSIGFGTQAANAELLALRATMNQLGISQEENLGMAVRYTTALKLSGKSAGEANSIFRDTSKIILANKLSAEDSSRVFKAMMQTASKGKLMAEELTGQLGDTLAGYMQQVATAMGISSGELMDRMKEGKVSAEEYFNAVKKVAEGIDDSKLNSAARSLGNLKNAFFDLKSSAFTAQSVKAALDAATTAMRFLTDHSRLMVNAVKQAAVAIATLAIARYASLSIRLLGAAFAEASMFATAFGVRATAAMYASYGLSGAARVAGLALKAMGGWIGLAVSAIVALGVAMWTATTRHKQMDAASDALSKSQSAMAGIIDLTTGKINTQEQALIRLARQLSATAMLKARDAETEARGNLETQLGRTAFGQTDFLGLRGIGMTNRTPEQQALYGLRDDMKRGLPTADVDARIEAVRKQFPQLGGALDGMKKQVEGLTAAQIGLKDATIQNMLVMGRVNEMTPDQLSYARARGFLAMDGTAAPQAPASTGGGGSTSRADPFADRMTALREQLAELQAKASTVTPFGVDAQQSEEAKAIFETTNEQYGRFFKETAARKAELVETAKAVDALTASIKASGEQGQLRADQARDRGQLEYDLYYAEKYGESVGKGREALARFEIEKGKMRNASPQDQAAYLAEAQALDELARKARVAADHTKALRDIQAMTDRMSLDREGVALEARRLTMSTKAFEALKRELELKREIATATKDMSAEDAAAYAAAARAAWDLVEADRQRLAQRQNTAAGGAAEALHAYGEELAKTGEHWAAVWQKGLKGTEDALVNFVMTGKLNFRELALSIIADLARIAIQAAITAAITAVVKGVTGVPFSSGGAFDHAAQTNKKFAKGAPFGEGVHAFAKGDGFTNSVVRQPTLFNFMSRGRMQLGLMGEAGEEAVMPLGGGGVKGYGKDGTQTLPLRRGPDGRLGVNLDGAFAQGGVFGGSGSQAGFRPATQGASPITLNVEVNVNGNGGSETQVKGGTDRQDASALARAVSDAVKVEIIKQQRPGGLLAV